MEKFPILKILWGNKLERKIWIHAKIYKLNDQFFSGSTWKNTSGWNISLKLYALLNTDKISMNFKWRQDLNPVLTLEHSRSAVLTEKKPPVTFTSFVWYFRSISLHVHMINGCFPSKHPGRYILRLSFELMCIYITVQDNLYYFKPVLLMNIWHQI